MYVKGRLSYHGLVGMIVELSAIRPLLPPDRPSGGDDAIVESRRRGEDHAFDKGAGVFAGEDLEGRLSSINDTE